MSRSHWRWGITAFLLQLPIAVLSVPIGFSQTNPPLISALALGFTSSTLSGLVGYLVWTSLSNWVKEEIRFFASAAIFGLSRGLLLYFGARIFGLTDPLNLFQRMLNATLITFSWFTAATYVIEKSRAYYEEAGNLYHQRIQGQVSLSLDEHPDLLALRSRLSKSISSEPLTSDSAKQIAQAIHFEIAHSLRPLSHRLWIRGDNPIPRNRIWPTLIDAIRESSVPSKFVLSFYALTLTLGAPVVFGLVRGLITAGLSTLTLGLLLALYKKCPADFGQRLAAIFMISLLAAALPDLLLVLNGQHSVWSAFPLVAVLHLTGTVALIVTGAFARLLAFDREQVLSLLTTDSGIPNEHSRTAAGYLHHSVQSQLLSVSWQLQNAAESGDTIKLRESLERLQFFLGTSLDAQFQQLQTSPLDRLKALVLAWQGIVDINLNVNTILSMPEATAAVVVQTVEELVSNAARHAHSTKISVSVSKEAEGIQLLVEGDAIALAQPRNGLGSQWLDMIAPNKWELKVRDDTFFVRAVLAGEK